MGFSRQEYWSGVPSPSPTVVLYDPKLTESTNVKPQIQRASHEVSHRFLNVQRSEIHPHILQRSIVVCVFLIVVASHAAERGR